MSKRYRPSVFKGSADRDDNEPLFLEILRTWHIEYSQGKPGDGYDVLGQTQPMFLLEIKNPAQPPAARRLTEAEKAKQAYCKTRGIPYYVFEYTDQLVDMLSAHFAAGGR